MHGWKTFSSPFVSEQFFCASICRYDHDCEYFCCCLAHPFQVFFFSCWRPHDNTRWTFSSLRVDEKSHETSFFEINELLFALFSSTLQCQCFSMSCWENVHNFYPNHAKYLTNFASLFVCWTWNEIMSHSTRLTTVFRLHHRTLSRRIFIGI